MLGFYCEGLSHQTYWWIRQRCGMGEKGWLQRCWPEPEKHGSTLLFGGEACGKSTLLDLFTGRPVRYPRGGSTGTALSPHSFLCQIQGSSSEMLLAFCMKLLSLQDNWHPKAQTVMPDSLPGHCDNKTPLIENHSCNILLVATIISIKYVLQSEKEIPSIKHRVFTNKNANVIQVCKSGFY